MKFDEMIRVFFSSENITVYLNNYNSACISLRNERMYGMMVPLMQLGQI